MSETRIGMKHSIKVRQKMSIINSGKNNPNYGKCGKDSARAKAIIINSKCFDTLKKAAEFLNIAQSSLRYRILHKTKWMDYHYVENVMEVQDVKDNS